MKNNDNINSGPGVAIYVRVSSAGQLGRDGDEDGYSIPAQVKACERVAIERGYDVVKVYAERAESARSDNRPVLQKMLKELPGLGVEALIVHKVDRLARNRLDDALLYKRLVGMGVQLISATENIDETPAGQLMHGMLASFAEFYSNNLAAEVKKGLQQKHASGGTPFRPPIGYKPHRVMIGSQDIRTVVLDDERAPLVRMAFQLYASGDWRLIKLTAHLTQLGLTTRPSAKRAAKPLAVSTLYTMLTNEYYTGIVIYQGKRVVGRHEPLVDDVTFAKVQTLLSANRHGECASKHEHYLRSTVFCECCGGRLLFGRHRSQTGTHYEYFSCINRASRRRSDIGCTAPYFRVDAVEEKIEDLWSSVTLTPETIAAVRRDVAQYIDERAEVADREVKRHQKRIREVEDKQRKLLDLHYRDLISDDVFEKEQARLREDRAAITALQEVTEATSEQVEGQLETAIVLLEAPGTMYRHATPIQRRALNRWFWQRIDVGEDGDVLEAAVTPLPDAFRPWQPGLARVRRPDGCPSGQVRADSQPVHLVREGPAPAGPSSVPEAVAWSDGQTGRAIGMVRLRSTALIMSIPVVALAAGGAVAVAQAGGEGDKEPAAIVADVKRDLAKVKSYHFAGSETEGGTTTKLAGDVFASGPASVTVTEGAATLRMVVLPKAVYLKANAAFWKASGGKKDGAALARKLAGRWVKESAKSGKDLTALFADLTPKHLAKCIDQGTGTLTKRPSESVAGQDAIVLQDAGDKPGTTPGRIYLTPDAPVLPLRIVQTGPRKAGKAASAACDDPGDKSTKSDIALSAFDKAPRITAPKHAISLDDLASEGGGGNSTPI
jgi:DNA invertase Pin-like site-specific DNA recombinase